MNANPGLAANFPPQQPSPGREPRLELPPRPLVYIASPLTHPDPAVLTARQTAAADYAALLVNQGVIAYAPVTYTRLLTELGAAPPDWYQFDLHFLARADELRILTLPGWEQSYGVQLERQFAAERNITTAWSGPWRQELAGRLPPDLLDLLVNSGPPG